MTSITLRQLAEIVNFDFCGDGDTLIEGVSSLDSLRPGTLVMVEGLEQLEAVSASEIGAVLRPDSLPCELSGFSHPNPRILLAQILQHFHPSPKPIKGVHPTATVDRRAQLDPSAQIGPHCVIGPNAVIGADVILMGFVVIGENSVIGAKSILCPHVVVGVDCHIGQDCQLEGWSKLGDSVTLGDEVDLGAHTSVSHHSTIQSGAKCDNLVLVGPRSQIGAGSLLVGQSAVDRDATLHSAVVIAGQGSVGPEAILHSGVQVGGRSLALGELKEPGPYLGNPAIALKDEMRRRVQEKKAARS